MERQSEKKVIKEGFELYFTKQITVELWVMLLIFMLGLVVGAWLG